MSASAHVEGAGHWQIRIRGIVQGVGFRPAVWRLAEREGLLGAVLNDGDGVLIRIAAGEETARRFARMILDEAPLLASIHSTEISPLDEHPDYSEFAILPSAATTIHTPVTPDAATCDACTEEVTSPFERRFRYPFTNCTHCGPRYSIVRGIPYDRANTAMAEFPMCGDCRREYETPADRRFHAQPIACHVCGPRAWLVRLDGKAVTFDQHSMLDDVDAVAGLLHKGEIVAIRGVGGFHLACDATNARTVARLRERKQRDAKPFALMARDLELIRDYCRVSPAEQRLLTSPAAPIVLLDRRPDCSLPPALAPGLGTLGFMLPSTPLHHLILRRMRRPVVMTSGNLSSEPQVIANADVERRLGAIASHALFHNREIENRIDDSVTRVVLNRPRVLRRARGYAPAPVPLPPGFGRADGIVAYGAELKSTFCLVKDGQAILSPHQGDLEEATTYDDFVRNLALFGTLFGHRETLRVADRHPDYLSSKLARSRSAQDGVRLLEVQHHHAHAAACMAENEVPLDTKPMLAICLDGLGYGDDGTIWGGEFLLADYRAYRRVGTFKPVAMLGGTQAIREPWRNTYAHLLAEIGWQRFVMDYAELDLVPYFEARPRAVLDRMLAQRIHSPLASSCGRLFDAVAAAVGLCRDRAAFEGQAAMELEAAVDPAILSEALAPDGSDALYPFSIPHLRSEGPHHGLPYIEPMAMWQALLGDRILGTPVSTIAARFHRGLARVIARMAAKVLAGPVESGAAGNVVALSGGCFQNRILLTLCVRELEQRGVRVLTHATVPANDGGISLGQAAVAAAALIRQPNGDREEPCA